MKHLLITASALALLAGPAMAGGTAATGGTTTTTSKAASAAEAVAITGGSTTIFEATRSRDNTPDAYSHAPGGTTDCTNPGFSFGIGQPGLGLTWGVPLGTDADCKHERMAKFRMQSAEMLLKVNPAEAARNIAAANESLCRISYNAGTAMCAPAAGSIWYCDNPAGYYPAVPLCTAWRLARPR